MKDQKFSIKISDLLNNAGQIDEIVFEKKFSDDLPNLTEEGISWTFVMQSLNDSTLIGTLTDVNCTLKDVCDSCQKNFEREINVPEYSAKFTIKDSHWNEEDEEKAEDEVFFIDPKNELIDIGDMVIHTIKLQDPVVKRCDICEKKMENVDDDEEEGYMVSSSNIQFS